ncbi:hypothetical protein HU200_010508 [Digitaria exilis]|uniref:Uncharacterized protein n=1 Tax=Digitaria exilis TaxID=1010633 RepID=A0A835FJC8_9POAL|nr:hypothetical protein HU200_010508 [Digitaria exilis]
MRLCLLEMGRHIGLSATRLLGPFVSLCVYQAAHHCLHLSDVDDAKLVAAVVGIQTRDVVNDLDLCHGPREAVSTGAPQLTDSAIGFVTSACRNLKNLKFLHVEGSLSITEASLRALMQDAKRFESLTLGTCPQIGEDAILSFLTNQPYLGKLELKGMMAGESHWSGERQSSALDRHFCLFHQLSTLILVKCPDMHIRTMFGSILQPLEEVILDDCPDISDGSAVYLQLCRDLIKLSLNRVDINDSFISTLIWL